MKQFTSKSQKIGLESENIASQFLMKRGFKILLRNYTKKYGEIDIVAEWKNNIHFIEVKSVSCEIGENGVIHETRSGIRPEENMTPQKIRRLQNTLQIYLAENQEYAEKQFQLDLVCVYLDTASKRAKVSLIENIIV